MRILLSWLREYIDIEEAPEKLAEILTNAGMEVDSVEKITPSFQGVIAARVTKAAKHPQAERLTLAEVFDGTNTLSIVCGAPNCREGILVALAPIGATLYPKGSDSEPLVITKATIRGVESSGMLCSEDELGLSKDGAGIIELEGIKEGTPLRELFSDVVFEISLTPNLGHAMSVLGIARELSAILKRPLKQSRDEECAFSDAPGDFRIINEAIELCPRYSALLIKDIQVTPSPFWLKLKLERSGIRSVNAIVDITNLVSHGLGQPLHAFDMEKLSGKTLRVRLSQEGEEIHLLDGTKKRLSDGAIVICDASKAVAVGGVMGDLTTAVSDTTKTLLLESAHFSPVATRRARKALGLMTESSKRFERGCDPEITKKALQYAYALIKKVAPKASTEGFYDIAQRDLLQAPQISCRLSRIEKILGFSVSKAQAEDVFTRLGFQVRWENEECCVVTPPLFRHDIKEEIDLIEEVSRLLGMEQETGSVNQYIGSKLPHDPLYLAAREIRQRLLTEGLQEFITCSLMSPKLIEIVRNHPISQESLVKVMNPMSEEQSILRPSLLPGFLDTVKRNINQRTLDIAAFEIGNVHFKRDDKFQEELVVGIVLSGSLNPSHFTVETKEADFFDLKGIIENVLTSLRISSLHFEPSNFTIFHPGRQAKVISSGVQIGSIGELHPSVLRAVDIPQRVLFAEFNVRDLLALDRKPLQFVPLAEFPGSDRDWTVTMKEEITYDAILKAVQGLQSKILEKVELIAIFRHEKLGPDHKNVTLRFSFRDRQRTISQEEVDREHERLTAGVLAAIGKK